MTPKTLADTRAGISIRLPIDLHQDLSAIATATGQTLNSVVQDAFRHRVVSYVGTPDYNARADARQSQVAADEAALRGESAARAVSRRRRGLRPPAGEAVPVVVRVDGDVDYHMRAMARVLGITLSEVVLEATREWVRFYPGTDHFRCQVEQSHEDHQSAVRRALSAAGLTEEGSARLADISSAGDPPRR